MTLYNYADARRNLPKLFETAMREDVLIRWRDGRQFKLSPVTDTGEEVTSPLEAIQGVNANVTMDDILDAIKDRKIV